LFKLDIVLGPVRLVVRDIAVRFVLVRQGQGPETRKPIVELLGGEIGAEGVGQGCKARREEDVAASLEHGLGGTLDEQAVRAGLGPSEDRHGFPVPREFKGEKTGDARVVVVVDGGRAREGAKGGEGRVEGVLVRRELFNQDFEGRFGGFAEVGVGIGFLCVSKKPVNRLIQRTVL
jgi:hypothetical protein